MAGNFVFETIAAQASLPGDPAHTPYGDAPSRPFHRRLVLGGAGGQFADAFSLGIIGIAVTLAKEPLGLSAYWMGALAAASLAGLFIGSLLGGPICDKIGRRPIFRWDMLFFTFVAVLQFLVTSVEQLLLLRILLGIALGADYVSSFALVTEFAPSRLRGRLMSVLAVAWAVGYLAAYIVGFFLRDIGPDAWRWALLSSAVPSLLVFVLRFGTPESPLWLVIKGRLGEARVIITKHLGSDVALPPVTLSGPANGEPRNLLAAPLRTNLIVGCVFYTAQVIPFFALGSFLPIVMFKLGVEDGYTGALVLNVSQMLGAILGLLIVDRVSRRFLLIGSFSALAVLMTALALSQGASTLVLVPMFAVYAFVLATATVLEFVYPPELFPTDVRATGCGVIIACSRIGSAVTTFLLPSVVDGYGVHAALGSCSALMVMAALVCGIWAPETRQRKIA